MNTRYALLTVLFGLCAMPGCTQPGEVPVAHEVVPDENPKAGGLPEAPAPRVKKTTAELLVGAWKTVKRGDQDVPKEWTLVMEFTPEGKLHIFTDDKKNPPSAIIGTYKLEGHIIHLQRPDSAEYPAMKWTVDIDTISVDALTLTKGSERTTMDRLLAK